MIYGTKVVEVDLKQNMFDLEYGPHRTREGISFLS